MMHDRVSPPSQAPNMSPTMSPEAAAAWEKRFTAALAEAAAADPAHDILHVRRVVHTAKALCAVECGRLDVVLPAAWLHDLVAVPKDDPRRSSASRLSAEAATGFLRQAGYPAELLPDIAHAIEAHSFSARVTARTLEARIVQDADRLDGLGAIGIARCFATTGVLGRPFYSEDDPFCETRPPDDGLYAVDHFYTKLFRTAETLTTEAGRAEGRLRAEEMRRYLSALARELG
ncbi:HD domain-containing protein [Desulfovibrio sp. X2]|uniref:HD domain-containing protein n=1 Tax=Desulfovibrio sp. X2 TaxID=941449 RepID=UPI00054DF6E4|nr:HD domain-containing protein [Desulfovibrio sp. X2]